jgi:hypothetical protein
MSKSDAFEADLLKLIFQAVPITGLAQNAASPITNISVALHTQDPLETGNQSSFEVAYANYARVNVPRSSGGWTVTGSNPTTVSPLATISFPQAGTVTGTITASYFSLGPPGAVGSATEIYYSGTVSPPINISTNVTPQLTTSSAITED